MGRDKRRSNSALLRGTIPLSRFVSSRPGNDMQDFTRQHRIFARRPFYGDPNIILMRGLLLLFSAHPCSAPGCPLANPIRLLRSLKEHAHTRTDRRPAANSRRLFGPMVRTSTRVTFTPDTPGTILTNFGLIGF